MRQREPGVKPQAVNREQQGGLKPSEQQEKPKMTFTLLQKHMTPYVCILVIYPLTHLS